MGALLMWLAHAVGSAVWSAAIAELRSQRVGAQVESAPAVVDFDQFGPSDWERVYFFHPYTPHEYVNQTLGFGWDEVERTSIEGNEGVVLVVFVRGGRVVGWFEHPRNRGDLTELATGVGFLRGQARFCLGHDQEGRAVPAAP
ncbi:hypothetical protein [Frigoriglobus tundricola]|uniref:Uncharacterized protein n=1 Tax=Frigoriglobus tundricola TaxID=2774151 RepID=A0A6M5YYP8_9BACT|nr:hypothetical protein [Frigoriglobus tundricola]QJW98590.1 hypothetical protein FTUN_6185 [Frigoriglobus tundricola]